VRLLLCTLWVTLALATAGITRASADPCVAERIARVDIEGARGHTDALAPLAVLQGTLDDPRRTERVVRVATTALRAAGYARATIDLAREDRCGVSLTATVTLGPRFRIGAITFVTDDAFPAASRLSLIEDSLGTVNTVGGLYAADRLDHSLAELRRRYRDAGWARASIGTVEADYDDSSGRVSLRIPINAGPRFRIGAVSAVNAGADGDKLFAALGLEEGSYYDRDKLRTGIRRARRVLGRGIRIRAVIAPGDAIDVEAVVGRSARDSADDDVAVASEIVDAADRYRNGIASTRSRTKARHADADEQVQHPRSESGECRYADDDGEAAARCTRTAPVGGRHIDAPSRTSRVAARQARSVANAVAATSGHRSAGGIVTGTSGPRPAASVGTATSDHRAADAKDYQ
jgi:hypothetical protein